MELSYLLLIITCFIYGMSSFIESWDEFGEKLVNVLIIIAIIVLTLITCEDGFISLRSDVWWLNILTPIPAAYIGGIIGNSIGNDDWKDICSILSLLGLIATIITTCCGL